MKIIKQRIIHLSTISIFNIENLIIINCNKSKLRLKHVWRTHENAPTQCVNLVKLVKLVRLLKIVFTNKLLKILKSNYEKYR